ncbi:DEAD helicases superfamily protein-like protein, partial [Erysiphe pulchra]
MASELNETSRYVPSVRNVNGEHQCENQFLALARKHWLNSTNKATKIKVKQDLLKSEIWDVLEKDDFGVKSLSDLENVQILEAYLWPGYSDDSSNFHVLLIILISIIRTREHLPIWDIFLNGPDKFSSLFRRIISLSLDTSLSAIIRTYILSFIIISFQSLDCGIVRKECAPLVSISIWHNIHSDEKRNQLLDKSVQIRKAWKAAEKRYDTGDESVKSKLRFDRSWLYTLILDFLKQLYSDKNKPNNIRYCERFIEFLSDLQSQLPTRRYVNTIIQDLNTLPAIRLSRVFNQEENKLLRDLFALLKHFTYFPVDDHTGTPYGYNTAYEVHSSILAMLQRTALKHFKEKLTILALSNYGSIDKRSELQMHLDALTDKEIISLCKLLQLRTIYPASSSLKVDRNFFTEVLLSHHERKKTYQEVARDLTILPTEQTLFESALLRNDSYNGSQPLAIPKLNLQYLTVGDFLWRSLVLHRSESFYEIRKNIEDIVKRLKPTKTNNGKTRFEGFSKMALPITRPAILEVAPALVGSDRPSIVRAEIKLDFGHLSENIQREWCSLRPDDVVFILAIHAPDQLTSDLETPSDAQKLGLKYLRVAEIIQLQDEKGRVILDQNYENGHDRPQLRKLQVKLDTLAYKKDLYRVDSGKSDVYEFMNVLVRRRGRENNFKPILESIQSLTLSDVPLAPWLLEVFLGYGDPASASYPRLLHRIENIDYRDTFLDWEHLSECLSGNIIEPSDNLCRGFGPPYIINTIFKVENEVPTKTSKKRRLDVAPTRQPEAQIFKVSTYKLPNTGPYPADAPKLNKIRFTPTQAKAIISGCQLGLTLIVGPPGTGKTDVATQIINIIYHNFPDQRTLLIAHSNQALNQLFQKIVALDIDSRHLLRLGHGEDLDTEANFSKYGRVESFLENREIYLREVDRLAENFGAPGAHGNSAETAGYFNLVYVEPAWKRFQETTILPDISLDDIIGAFPFHQYFSNAPQPLFPVNAERAEVLEIANGCYYHISKIFTELSNVRPFEVLKRDRDKANYLLTSEARIIAMTSTHAAIRRREIATLGFQYDNVIMEEAAQITEIENFIPLALQTRKDGEMPLKRVVLCGDHFQNSPIIQNLAFRHYAHLDESLFSRFIRLGVPAIKLDQQGRARPSIATLYSWRYENLGNLPIVSSSTEYQLANAGFKYDYQFINVVDYKGKGESEPTPHFTQNLGEAEYAVAIYQYMRLLGYPAAKISILATYAGQRALLKDVLNHRCARNSLFGFPKIVTTVDKYQGEQNDYVILSLTRTSRVGYLRDVRRLTVALSRARLGLYIIGRRAVFESCSELRPAFDILFQRPDKLMLVTGELWPCQRIQANEPINSVPGETQIEDVEHMGLYVYEMTNARAQQIRDENIIDESRGENYYANSAET